ncbi:MAG: hypothetical protein IJR14_07985, partial [Synergistaceae bacterium]|nr:hypothetical protein [Synergistaceae bacterium]
MRFVEDISGIAPREEAQAAGGVKQQQTWGTGEERRAALTRRAVGAQVAERARLRQDTLKLEYPALAEDIDRLLTKGWSRDDLRRHYAGCETRAHMFYSPEEVDAALGRTDQTKRDLWDAMSAQRDDAYVRIMRNDMSERKVRDILHTAKSAGIAPGLLLRNYDDPKIMEAAERLAGTRMGVVDMTLSAVKNMVAQYQSSLAGKQRMDAQGLRQKMEDREALIEEGRRSLGLDMVREDEVHDGWTPLSDEKLMEAGRASFEQRIAALEAGATKDEADAGEWQTHYRPPESELGAFILNGIENGAFTLKSAFLSGTAWGLGGPVTGLLMTAYNTIDESRTEAGEVFVEGLRRGWDPKKAYEAAMKAERENMALLTATNYAFDILTFGLGGAGRGLVKLGGRAAKTGGALGRVGHFLEHGMSDWLSRQAGKITGDKLAARLARGAI